MTTAAPSHVAEALNYIGGEWSKSSAGQSLAVTNPATAEVIGSVAMSNAADVGAAVEAAEKVAAEWRRTPPGERVQYLFKLKQLLEVNLDELARTIVMENGKTLAEARGELRRAIENNRNSPTSHLQPAAAFVHLDRLNEARSAAQAGLALNPSFTIARFRIGTSQSDNPTFLAQRERLIDGFRKAGAPEG